MCARHMCPSPLALFKSYYVRKKPKHKKNGNLRQSKKTCSVNLISSTAIFFHTHCWPMVAAGFDAHARDILLNRKKKPLPVQQWETSPWLNQISVWWVRPEKRYVRSPKIAHNNGLSWWNAVREYHDEKSLPRELVNQFPKRLLPQLLPLKPCDVMMKITCWFRWR